MSRVTLNSNGARVEWARCVKTTSTIKTEVLARAECDVQKVASNRLGLCRLQHSEVSSYRSTFRAKAKSHTSRRKQQRAKNDVSMACAKF